MIASARGIASSVRAALLLPGLLLGLGACMEPRSSEGEGEAGDLQTQNPPDAELEAERDAVLGVARGLLRAITEADSALARQVLLPGAVFFSVGEDPNGGDPRIAITTAEQFIPGIGDPEQGFVERMWDPRVRVRGPIATVWAPYDFYIGGVFSHCGVDTVQLVKTGAEWKVQSVLYSLRQPPACPLHPDGPPARAAESSPGA